MNDNLTFGQWLKARMQDASLTVAKLADDMGRGPAAIWRWRNGDAHPVGKSQERLAALLNVPEREIRIRVFKERRARHAHGSTAPVSA